MNWIKNHLKLSGAVAGSIIGLIILSVLVLNIQTCSFWHDIKNDQNEVNKLTNQAIDINTDIANLKLKEVEAQANANAANAELQRIQNEVNKAKEIANQALTNVNNVANANYNGTSPDAANRARCAAFPDSIECQP